MSWRIPTPYKIFGRKRPVTVIGAGFSGLTTAFYLSRAGFQVDVFEEQDRVGGLISTVRTSFGFVETAANGLLSSARVEELFAALELPLTPTLKESRKRFIFRKGVARRWPLGVSASLRLALFLFNYFLFRRFVAPRKLESVRKWAERVVGFEASRYLIETALQGIYAGDPARLSASVIFGSMFDPRAKKTRPRRGQHRGTVCAPDGMGELMLRLRERLEKDGVVFRTKQKFAAFETWPAHPHIIATSCEAAARLLAKIDVTRSSALEKIEQLPLLSATVNFRDPPPQTRGFGCLFPPTEERPALGVLMNNYIFPHRVTRGSSETWIFGGALSKNRALETLSDQEIVNLIADERYVALGASGETLGSHLSRWPKALPHYSLELERLLPELIGFRQNVGLVGNYLGQIGLAKILELAARVPLDIENECTWPKRE